VLTARGVVDAAQGVLHDDVVAVGGEQDADGGLVAVLGSAEQVVHDGDVEAELAEVFGFCPADFELEDDVPA